MSRSGIMALIKCPECGKEVSDSATMCPSCGFNVKNFVDNQNSHIINPVAQKEAKSLSNIPKNKKDYNKKQIVIIGCISIAIIFIAVVFVFGSKVIKYNNAVRYYDMQEWSMAIEKFEELGVFLDSQELLQKAKIELASDDYELGVYAYNTGDFATSVYLLKEAKSLCPTYSGLEDQLRLSDFMDELQGIWSSADAFYIEVDGNRARLKDYHCTSYAEWCDIAPYEDENGYLTIKVNGEQGNRLWELKYKEGSSDPNDTFSSDWVGYPSNTDTGLYFRKEY